MRFARKMSAIGALVVASILFAIPAHALGSRTLPGGETLFALDNNASIGTLYTLDAQTAAPEFRGGPGSASAYADNAQGAYNPADGQGYWIGFDGTSYDLVQVDPGIGDSTRKGSFNDGLNPVAIIGMAIDEVGNAYGFDSSYLYSIDLTNALVTPIGALTPVASLKAFAFNPADQTFYAVGNVAATNATLYSVDVASGALTPVASGASFPLIEPGEKRVMSLAFDSDGQMWGIDANRKLFGAASVSTFASSLELVGLVTTVLPDSIFIQYTTTGDSGGAEDTSGASGSTAHTLAQTGSDSATMIAIALGAVTLTGTGIALIVRARRRNP